MSNIFNSAMSKTKLTVLDFLYYSADVFDPKKYQYIKKEIEDYLVVPLRVITFLIAISGLFAMIFEVRYYSEFSQQVYITRLTSTLIAFIILVILNSKHALKKPVLLVHILLITIIISSGYMIYLMPKTLVVNAQIVGLMIFTSALFLSWEVKNQIIVAIYYNIVFAAAILFNQKEIYFLPNMFESVVFVLFMSVISVIGSAVNFKLRSEVAEKSFKINASEKKFRSIINNSLIGFFQTSLDGKIKYANPALIKMLGFNSDDDFMLVNSLETFYTNSKDREIMLNLLNETGTIRNFQLILNKKDGTKIYTRCNAKLILDEDDNNYYIEGNIQDITEQIKLDIEKRKIMDELIDEKIKSEQLAKEALQASSIKSQFLANMSHEIRTPINGVIGYLSLIEQKIYKNENELEEFVTSAKSSAETLLSLINDILDFSKIEAGKFELGETTFSLNQIISDAISTVLTDANKKGLKILVDYNNRIPSKLIGDDVRIRQIYTNLLSNAVKFTNKGYVIVKVDFEKLNDGRLKIISNVEDSGIGIPNDKIDNLFSAFSQIDSSLTKKYGGTGLGLAICKQLVQMMDGDISVKSEVNKGSVFTFSILLKEAKNTTIISTLKEKTKSNNFNLKVNSNKIFSNELRNKRALFNILLVEDNLVNQKVTSQILTEAGYKVSSVFNGLEAIESIKKKSFYNLILMDVQMPVMDGFTATQQIRALNDYGKNIPIIAITANALSGDKDKCLIAGMNDYISKPIRTNDLVFLIDKWLGIESSLLKEETNLDDSVLFDDSYFNSISSNDNTFQKNLLDSYITDTINRMGKISSLIDQNEIEKITIEIHTIKGASFSIGAKKLGNMAKIIEDAVYENDIDKVKSFLPKLQKIFLETKNYLNKYL